jgi:hypothetical protein
MSEQDNFDALFNPQIDMGGATGPATEEYRVGADQGKNGVYQSVIRFIPWYKNPSESIIEKWVSWLVDPVTQKGRFVDCPSSIGKQSPLQDMFWKLKKSESVQEQKKAEVFSRRHSFTALIQVIKDDNQPDLEGKILVYRFGKKLWEKINAEMKPVIGEPHNPFDLLNGKAFALIITKVSGFNNYDQSKFVDKVIPLAIPSDKGELGFINANTDKQSVFNFLKENSPELDKYGFKDWDQETHDYVNGVIAAVTGRAVVSTNMASVQAQTSGSNPTGQQSSNTGISSTEISLEDLDTDQSSPSDMPSIDLPDIPDVNNDLGDIDDVLKGL